MGRTGLWGSGPGGDSSLSDELGAKLSLPPGSPLLPARQGYSSRLQGPLPGPPSSTFPGLRPWSRAGGEPCSLLRPPAFLQMRFRLPPGFSESAGPNRDRIPMSCGSLVLSCLPLKGWRSRLRKFLASHVRARIQTQTCPPPELCPAVRSQLLLVVTVV